MEITSTWLQTLNILIPFLVALATSGGIAAYFSYRSKKPESMAKAKQINVSAEITLGEGWRLFAEKQIKEIEDRYGKIIDAKDRQLEQKDRQIEALERLVNQLTTDRQDQVEVARDKLHKDVDHRMQDLSPAPEHKDLQP